MASLNQNLQAESLLEKYKEKEVSLMTKRSISMNNIEGQSYMTSGKVLTYKNPTSQPLHKNCSIFERYNDLPADKLKILFDPRIVKFDRNGVELIEKKLNQEKENVENKLKWITENRYKTLAHFIKKKQKTDELQEKSGLKYIKTKIRQLSPNCNDRLNELSTPKFRRDVSVKDLVEARGLLTIDYQDAIKASVRENRIIKTSQQALRKPDNFPFPDSMQSSGKPIKRLLTAIDSRARPINSILSSPSPPKITEVLNEIDKFHRMYGELKGRVGFPQIDLEKYKS